MGFCLPCHLVESESALGWRKGAQMKTFKAVFERDVATGLLVGYVPGFAGAHTQGGTLEELRSKLAEVLAMLLEDGEPQLTLDFIGVESDSA